MSHITTTIMHLSLPVTDVCKNKIKVKGKVHLRTGHDGPAGE
jgi:hypothetical protein